MEEIVTTLMKYCISFSYENRNSMGEVIEVHEIDVKISTSEGNLYFEHECQTKSFVENPHSWDYANCRVEELIINATSSF